MSPTVYRPAFNPRKNYNRLRIAIGIALAGLVALAASGALEARPLEARHSAAIAPRRSTLVARQAGNAVAGAPTTISTRPTLP